LNSRRFAARFAFASGGFLPHLPIPLIILRFA